MKTPIQIRILEIILIATAAALFLWFTIAISRSDETPKPPAAVHTNAIQGDATNVVQITNTLADQVIILTITNCVYLQFPGTDAVFNLSAEEWAMVVTNYPERLKTNTVFFYVPAKK